MMKRLTGWLAIVWAAPCSALGVAVGLAAVASGGRARRVGRDPYRDNPFEVQAYREAP